MKFRACSARIKGENNKARTLTERTVAISMKTISLDGAWRLAFFPQPADGAVRSVPVEVPTESVEAEVPGNCELDLMRAGLLPPPETGLNALRWRRFEGHQWLYSRSFEAPAVPRDGSRATLLFEGIDTLADVFLNGERIGESADMLVERRFDVTRRLRAGENTVQVLLRSAALEAQRFRLGHHARHAFCADGVPLRKAAHMGGWDIFPRLYLAGLWRGVRLEIEDPVRVADPFWTTFGYGTRADGARTCRVRAQFRVEAPMDAFLGGARVRLRVSRGGAVVAEAERRLHLSQNAVDFDAAGFALWWPSGAGEQPLYDASIEVLDAAGAVLAREVRRIGFRTLALKRRDRHGPDAPGEFRFVVNGEPLFMRGTNWVPVDAIPSRQAARILPTLALVEESRCNMLRVWGGGVYEPDFFYDWCDEHGVLVWQDFMTGCAQFPQDDAYAAATAEEARAVVLRLRNHASLALWAGNNENDESLTWGETAGEPLDPNGDRLSREVLPRVLREFDPTRPYLPSSPYFSPEVFAGSAQPAERHLWGRREWYNDDFYLGGGVAFASETGWHGAPCRCSLEQMMSPECVAPWKNPGEPDDARLDWNDEWRLKASCPFLDPDSGLWRRNDIMMTQIRRLFGAVERDVDGFIAQSQAFQAEALKTMIETFRAGKTANRGGLLWWNVRDGWPQISDALVDWHGVRKPAFSAVRDAQRDVLALLLEGGGAFAVNDLLRPVEVSATFTERATGRVLLEGRWRVPANGVLPLGRAECAGPGVVDIAFTVDGGAPEYNYALVGEAPFDWRAFREWLPPRVVSGRVVKGHGVASGRAGDGRFPGGTIAMQTPFFQALGLDLSPFHPGTLNVDCAPWRYVPGPDALLFERVKWHPDMPAETFSFSRIRLVHRGVCHPALVYQPHPETKAEHFQPGCVAEVIAPKIEGLAYGDVVAIESDPRQVAWQWTRGDAPLAGHLPSSSGG